MPFFYDFFVLQEYFKLGILVIFSFFLSGILLFISTQLSVSNYDSEKLTPYECGFEPYEDARNVFDVRFYLIAILFLIFDLETLYFFPWVISFSHLNVEGFWFMFDFIVELLIGYIYAWQIGALDWD
jgi:NADH-quinone oxidoreductase subunit A